MTGTGRFRIPRLPAGDYYLVAVDQGLAGAWRDPDFLEATARVATRLTLDWGDTKVLDLVSRIIKP